jgi:hypothetical protein
MSDAVMTQEPGLFYPFLLRFWGGGQDKLAARYGLVQNDDEAYAMWFETDAARRQFIEAYTYTDPMDTVVFDAKDPSGDGDPWKQTIARVTLRLPDGSTRTYDQNFGYGYPWHSVEFMYYDGNYSCDCNRATFAGIDDDMPCGDTLELVRLEQI